MDFTIERNTLLKPLGHIYSIVERRNTIPILSNVLIETNSSKVSFTATDMDMDIVETATISDLEISANKIFSTNPTLSIVGSAIENFDFTSMKNDLLK